MSEEQHLWLMARIREMDAEVLEQARLLGMSGEREADLRGKVDRLKAENAKLREALEAWTRADTRTDRTQRSEAAWDQARRLTAEALGEKP